MVKTIFIGATLLLLLYIISSGDMIYKFIETSKILQEKVGLRIPFYMYNLAIFCVILLKIFGSIIILYSIWTNKYKIIAYYVTWLFILFNIAATLLFHIYPFDKQKTNLLKNISITGGFILLSYILLNERKSER
jgi:uncharacterized membrane protein YphA (DoxX/SURF4 family)